MSLVALASIDDHLFWADAGRAALVEADICLCDDDFDGACRRYLLAAWCFGLAATSTRSSADTRRHDLSAYRNAWRAAQPLLPDGGPAESSTDETASGTREPFVEQSGRVAVPAQPLTGLPQPTVFHLREVAGQVLQDRGRIG